MTDAARAALGRALPPPVRRLAPAGIGAVVGGVAGPEVVWHGFGSAGGAPVDERTVFRIASMSKSFLAAMLLSLRDEGLLDLHAPLQAYLPNAVLRWQGEAVTVTGAQLLSNRSGLGEDNPWGDRSIGIERGALLEHAAAGLTLSTPPGLEYQYSNTGMALLGAAAEAVTGSTVEQLVRERLLDPLGLRCTVYDPAELPADARLAEGARTFDDGASFSPEPLVGPGALGSIGGMFSTVGDIGRWMRFLSSAFDDDLAAPELLGRASRLELQTAHTVVPVAQDRSDRLEALGYGYGLVVEHDRRFGRIVQHAGGLPGWSSHMRWHAATGTGVVVFGASDSFGAGVRATEILRDVLTAAEAPRAVVSPWPETMAAAERVDALLRERRSFASLDGFAAMNLLPDVPAEVRDRQLGDLVRQFGPVLAEQRPLRERIVGAGDAGELRWRVDCEHGALVCLVRLVGLAHPLLQTLAVEAGPGPAAPPPASVTVR